MMEWIDETDKHAGVHDFVLNGYIDGDHRLVVWQSRQDMGYGRGICIQTWKAERDGRWSPLVEVPEGATVEEAKAMAVALYRMGG